MFSLCVCVHVCVSVCVCVCVWACVLYTLYGASLMNAPPMPKS